MIDRQPSEPTPIEIDDSITISNTTETLETTETYYNLSESTVNTETSNTNGETDVLPVIEERTGELSPERTRKQGPEEEEDEDSAVSRKSARRRNKPAWMKTGECHVATTRLDAESRVFKRSSYFRNVSIIKKDIGQALLKLVLENI